MSEISTRSPKVQSCTRASAAPPGSSHGDSSSDGMNKTPSCIVNYVLQESVSKSLPRLYDQSLIPIDLKFGTIREEEYKLSVASAHKKVLREAHMASGKAQASVCFVVKRPGCVLCHEQGQALGKMVAEFQASQVASWAVVKEVDVDNEGLLELYQKHFKFPFFRDAKLAMYSALGDRKVGVILNPVKILKRYMEIRKRLASKNIEGDIMGKGEGMLLGGVLIFDRKGEVRYAHQEQFGHELPVYHIREALKEIVAEGNEKSNRRSKPVV